MELLTPLEAARHLKVGRSTIYELIRTGRVPSVRFGARIVRVPREALEELVRHRIEGAGP